MDNSWDLYDTDPRCAEANAALDAAWQQAIRLAPEQPARERAMVAKRHVWTVMEAYAGVGANDTEPRAHLEHLVTTHFGLDWH